jgi:hypothetical protein
MGRQPSPQPERDQKMVAMYRQGLTLEKIGQSFGVTRERVRQILASHGVQRIHGGAAKRAEANQAVRKLRLDVNSLKRWGVTHEEMRLASASGLLRAYAEQHKNAKSRGITWNLTFGQWHDVWLISGKLDQRGRGKGKYVMSRTKDAGGYEIGNVHIQLVEENSREAVAKWRGQHKQHRGVYCLYPGTGKPYVVKHGGMSGKYLGRYETAELAAEARAEYMRKNGLSSSRGGTGRGWTFDARRKTKPYQAQAHGQRIGYFASAEEASAAYQAFWATHKSAQQVAGAPA